MRRFVYLIAIGIVLLLPHTLAAQRDQKWVVSWVASAHGPYPVGNPSAQPDQRFAFPSAQTGANDQTFRLIVRPDICGRQARLRLSNVFGTKAVTFDDVFVGLQMGGPALVKGTNQPVTFGGKASVTVAPGSAVWSDGVRLGFVRDPAELAGRKLAISFHVAGESGPMTWHAKALTTSYLTAPGAGSKGKADDEAAFPYSTASWFFLDAVEMMAPANNFAIVAFGDSITDGTASTMNGDDRWPDVLSRRPHRGGQCRHRRQSDRRAGGIRPTETVPGRAVGDATPRARRARALGRDRDDLARRDQRFQPQRQRISGEGAERHAGGRRAHSRAATADARDRRHGGQRARRLECRARLSRAG